MSAYHWLDADRNPRCGARSSLGSADPVAVKRFVSHFDLTCRRCEALIDKEAPDIRQRVHAEIDEWRVSQGMRPLYRKTTP